jgi:DNA topoisomerase-6 subunit B
MRFANRVPLQYQPGACAITEAVLDTNWKPYGLAQPKGSLPVGPLGLFVHIASVWVPFTSESKEAVAHYPEITKELRLGLQECGRRLGTFLRARAHADYEKKRFGIFELYLPEVARSLDALTGSGTEKIEKDLRKLAGKSTGLEGVDEKPEAPKRLRETEASYANGDEGEAPEKPKPKKGKAEQLALLGIAPAEPEKRKKGRRSR